MTATDNQNNDAAALTPSAADTGGTERVHAKFEGTATVVPTSKKATSPDKEYTFTITRLSDVEVETTGKQDAETVMLTVDDASGAAVADASARAMFLRSMSIDSEGFDWNRVNGRVIGTLSFDRPLPPVRKRPDRDADDTSMLPRHNAEALTGVVSTGFVGDIVEPAPYVRAVTPATLIPVRIDTTRGVTPTSGVLQFYEATLSWTVDDVDLDAHCLHFRDGRLIDHCWHADRSVGPTFWHYGPSSPDVLDERVAITTRLVDGVILYAVYAPRSRDENGTLVSTREIADSGTEVRLQFPNERQSLRFTPPDREGNLWVPFAIIDGRVVTPDAMATVDALPTEVGFRTLLPDLFPKAVEPPKSTSGGGMGGGSLDVALVPRDSEMWWLPLLAIVLTAIVWAQRGYVHGLIMAAVSAGVLWLVFRNRTSRSLQPVTTRPR